MLLLVDEFSGYLVTITMKSKSTRDIEDAFNSAIALFNRHGHKVVEVHCDSESSLKAAKVHLGNIGIRMYFVPPMEHGHRIERYVQTVNQRVECMKHSSPVDIAGKIDGELVKAAVFHLNDMPSARFNLVTPRMLVEGVKFTISDKDILIPFGTVAHLVNAEAKGPKSELGIVMGPSDDSRHAYDCFTFGTQRRIVRSARDIIVPDVIPEEVPWPVKPGRKNKPTVMNHGKQKKKAAVKPNTVDQQRLKRAQKVQDAEHLLQTIPHVVHRPVSKAVPQSAREGELSSTGVTPAQEGAGSDDESISTARVPMDGADSDDEAPGTLAEAEQARASERANRDTAARAQAVAKKLQEIQAARAKQAANFAAAEQKLKEQKKAEADAARRATKDAKEKITSLVVWSRPNTKIR